MMWCDNDTMTAQQWHDNAIPRWCDAMMTWQWRNDDVMMPHDNATGRHHDDGTTTTWHPDDDNHENLSRGCNVFYMIGWRHWSPVILLLSSSYIADVSWCISYPVMYCISWSVIVVDIMSLWYALQRQSESCTQEFAGPSIEVDSGIVGQQAWECMRGSGSKWQWCRAMPTWIFGVTDPKNQKVE